MSSNVQFSDICGENVQISGDKTTAAWVSKDSDGWARSELEIKPGEVIEVKVDGSGRCDVGFMTAETKSTFKTLNEIRAHRRTCRIKVTLKESGDEISSTFGEKIFKKKTEKESRIWISIFIRYGEMKVQLLTTDGLDQNHLKFSTNHGMNIKLENDNSEAMSICKNPASICFISERLEVGGTLNLSCEPEKEGDRPPSRYELKLQISDKDPLVLKNNFKYLFTASEVKQDGAPLVTLESIEKDECNGAIAITLSDSNTVQYKTAKGKQNTQILSSDAQRNSLWVVLDLYRVKIQAISYEALSKMEGVPIGATSCVDQPDSLPVRPRVTVVQPETCDQESQVRNDLIKKLEERVVSLEQELQNVRLQPQHGLRNALLEVQQELQNARLQAQAATQAAQRLPVPISNVPSIPDMNVLTDDLGDELNLQKRYPDLVRDIDTRAFSDHLYANEIITYAQMESIHAIFKQNGAHEANREILKIMKTKRIEKSVMLQIIQDTEQQHLLKLFFPPSKK